MANATTGMRHDNHSTTSQGAWSTKRIATTALLCALSLICTMFIQFPIIPVVPYLMYDPSGAVALVASFAFGPATGAIVSTLPNLVHVASAGGVWGTLMAVLASATLVVPAALVYRRDTTRRGAAIGMALGAVASLAACILGNIVVTPLYTNVTTEQVIGMIVPALLPFNLAKIAINCTLGALVYKPVSKALAA